MFGDNKTTRPYRVDDGSLKVVGDPFYTLQGEGPDAGLPAIFVRLAHCNLRCYFCDTEFETGKVWSFDGIASEVLSLSLRKGCNLLVITGGEPLLQNIIPLVKFMNKHGIAVSVETAGTLFYPELTEHFHPLRQINNNLIVCSPKTPKINPNIEKLVGAWKYIVTEGQTDYHGLPMMSTQIKGVEAKIFEPRDHTVPIFIQACDEQDEERNALNLELAADICMKRGWRLSVQLHKLVNLP